MGRRSDATATPRQRVGRPLDLVLWALQVVLAVVFVFPGANKFDPGGPLWTGLLGSAGAAFWIDVFAKIGLGQWFRYFTGALEVVCGALLLVPRAAGIAGALLVCMMIGAILAHLFILRDGLALVVVCGVLMLITSFVGWARFATVPPRRASAATSRR
jgi:putative oxidoreductase